MNRIKPRGARPRKTVLSRQSLHHLVADQLRDMIIHDELAEGQKVPVSELAEDLGVSLTPMREALKVLAEENLVEILPNRGARVKVHTVNDARQLFEVIAGLEALAAELAANRMTEAQMAELEKLHAEMRGFYESRQRTEYFDLNSRIHQAVIDFAGNDVLSATHTKLSVRANRGRYIAIADPDRWRQAMDEHEALMQAFRDGDADTARRVWRAHLQHTGEATCEVLRQRQEKAAADMNTTPEETDA
ncbi:MAG TPA: GntR family transcriptional regulator [Thermohalobaculum sp.]|nr:GntR family transcriptional regulator [Thermohalobaculum sp.]